MKKESKFRQLLDAAIKEAQYEVLREAEKALDSRAWMLDRLLYQDTSHQIYMNAIGEKSEALWKKRNEVRLLSKAYWLAAHEVNKRIKVLTK
jgi:hypothetical protein